MDDEFCACHKNIYDISWKYKCGFNSVQDVDNYLNKKFENKSKYNTNIAITKKQYPEIIKHFQVYYQLLPRITKE